LLFFVEGLHCQSNSPADTESPQSPFGSGNYPATLILFPILTFLPHLENHPLTTLFSENKLQH